MVILDLSYLVPDRPISAYLQPKKIAKSMEQAIVHASVLKFNGKTSNLCRENATLLMANLSF